MPHIAGGPRFDIMARKWHALAQRRLLDYSELYRSGRWTHYFASREAFAARMLDVVRAAKAWANLAGEPRAAPAIDPDDLRPAA
jgi:hypothetical protein